MKALSHTPEVLKGIGRGVEREALRISAQGDLSSTPHPAQLGSALTNQWITTDFSESLLEFITPVSRSVPETLGQLHDIHRFTIQNLGDEKLWPMSMPCFFGTEDDIVLAQYGKSNLGRMKTLYREGLKHRYGSVMQIISGVHFNFSFPDSLWRHLFGNQGEEQQQASISDAYFALIRNYYRFGWMIPYLFGASPALCGSFVEKSGTSLKFEKTDHNTCYLPYATSLRLSDLGYTNSAQDEIKVGFNSLEQYIDGVKQAINTPSPEFARIGVKDASGQYRQLNTNALQIENELYAPIRAKRVAKSGEKPSEALSRGGVEYIEVRSLDVNPYSPVGIDSHQIYFLDLLMLWCLLTPSENMDESELDCWRDNWQKIVLEGRKPGLTLKIGCNGERLTQADWGKRVFAELRPLAELLDQANGTSCYQQTCDELETWFEHPEKTLSGRLLNDVIAKGCVNSVSHELSDSHVEFFKHSDSKGHFSNDTLMQEATDSLARQAALEDADNVSFDKYLADYFGYTS
ncbi:glutamate--cysteine ligase [Veronia pacifica]|uniref:Glutamate--cysteine ligase n=1 Tax=Veronia pacifica TaxID=1080227 RepID=A0A1C3EB86_9GAMM|nr:glutamate--cysteine ligase [Veronia pacifica]